MHGNRNVWTLRFVLFAFLSVPAVVAFGGTCDHPVQFKDGLLAIQSNGCSLQQVLQAVQDQSGIEVEVPNSAAHIPVVIHLEPGDPGTVINSLLYGTPFNYFLVGGERNSVARVVVTEISAPPAPSTQQAPLTQVATAVPATLTGDPNKPKEKSKKKKGTKENIVASNDAVITDDEPQAKPELDDSTLQKLPPLPPGIPAAMWRMYPELVQNGGTAPTGPLTLSSGAPLPPQATTPGQPGAATTSSYFQDPPPLPKGVIGLPTLPPEIDPNMGRIYPYNLMQTINGPITYPNIVLPPMALPIGVAPGSHP